MTKVDIRPIQSSLPFFLFLIYMISFFLHFGGRFPPIAPLRPDFSLAMLVCLALFPYASTKADLLRLPVSKALTLLIATAFVTLPFVEWPGSVLRQNWQPFVKALLFFYFTVLTVDTKKRLRLFVFVFVGCQLFRVLEPLYLNITEGYLGSTTYIGGGEDAGRLSGAPSDVINPNGLGFVIATVVVFVHYLLWQSPSKLNKLLYLAVLPALLYAMILTMSRGGFLALLVGAWLIFRQSNHKAVLVLVAIGIAISGWTVMSDMQRDRYLSLISSDSQHSETAEGRIRGMLSEFRLGLHRPVFGHGLGTTPEVKANLGGKVKAAHNLYAELLMELGIVGLALFINFMVRVYRVVRSNVERLGQRQGDAGSAYLQRLNGALGTTFWVYAVYALNYYGLSQDYWYVFAGLCVAASVTIGRMMPVARTDEQGAVAAAGVRP